MLFNPSLSLFSTHLKEEIHAKGGGGGDIGLEVEERQVRLVAIKYCQTGKICPTLRLHANLLIRSAFSKGSSNADLLAITWRISFS